MKKTPAGKVQQSRRAWPWVMMRDLQFWVLVGVLGLGLLVLRWVS
jgi:hypothetical protein